MRLRVVLTSAFLFAAPLACSTVFGLNEGQLDQSVGDFGGSGDGGCDAALALAALDVYTVDALVAQEALCQDYCACMDTNCTNLLPQGSGCVDFCRGVVQSLDMCAIACRREHCGYAPQSGNQKSMHCHHAAGDDPAVCNTK
jgi:hypothetical protein